MILNRVKISLRNVFTLAIDAIENALFLKRMHLKTPMSKTVFFTNNYFEFGMEPNMKQTIIAYPEIVIKQILVIRLEHYNSWPIR